ncbi:MAG: hypothetical protein OXF79_17445 [Chloroflexi bacterium]|nr:hypothetical protein [Chloroflexota bacterium]
MPEDTKALGRVLRCYISAPLGVNVRNIRRSLMERNVQLLTPSDLSSRHGLHQSIRELILNADLVIGVLRRGRQSQAVLFELGMAAAMDRKVVVFAPPKGDYLSFNLQPFLVLRIGLRNINAIDFALDQILSAPFSSNRSRKASAVTQRTSQSPIVNREGELESVLEVGDARKFEDIISSGIRRSGVEVVARPTLENREMDLAVWADEFQYVLGNPLLIEIKLQLKNDEQIRAALKRCAAATEKSGGRWSLLIYGTGPKLFRRRWLSVAPTVLAISAADLFERMREQSFVEVVIGLRNLRAHGGEY